ncbi:hypothetical protein BX666DRAFT_1895734 [Dichotomocladium elegans]|nr:hypothetical protein BX666DRAFT_1895734 [Dichotomocladium elegans]
MLQSIRCYTQQQFTVLKILRSLSMSEPRFTYSPHPSYHHGHWRVRYFRAEC